MLQTMKLACENCGAPLEIGADTETLCCAHCGARHVVKHAGGTIQVKQITEAIGRVQAGTEKAVAELAIPRLEKELRGLETRSRKIRGEDIRAAIIGPAALLIVAGIVFCPLNLDSQRAMWIGLFLPFVLLAGAVGFFALSRLNSRGLLRVIAREIAEERTPLWENHQIVRGDISAAPLSMTRQTPSWGRTAPRSRGHSSRRGRGRGR